jgi:hypothetical protein
LINQFSEMKLYQNSNCLKQISLETERTTTAYKKNALWRKVADNYPNSEEGKMHKKLLMSQICF